MGVKMAALLGFLLLSVAMSAGQAADPFSFMDDGNHFLANCDGSQQNKDNSITPSKVTFIACLAYVQGINQGVIAESLATNTAEDQCVPANVSASQLLDTAMKFIRESPETRAEPTAVLVHRAIAKAFPCETK